MHTRAGVIDLVMPFVRKGKVALALATLLAGCECSSDFLVHLTPEEGAKLRDLYGDGDLPYSKCNDLCIPPNAVSENGGGPVESAEDAGFSVHLCHVVEAGAGPAVICKGSFPANCVGGRKPAGEVLTCPPAANSADQKGAVNPEGKAFAALAQMESASVLAFVELAVELVAHGAPEPLVRRALSAAIDEVGHGRGAARLALVRGTKPEPVVVTLSPIRPLEKLLTENAVDGIVLEGWAAHAAAVDACRSTAVDIRQVLSTIAVEESEHAALGRAIHQWAKPRVSLSTQAAAREATFESLRSLVAAAPSPIDPEWETRVRAFARTIHV